MRELSSYRSEFPISKQFAYLGHAAISPTNRRVSQAIQEYIALTESDSPMSAFHTLFEQLSALNQNIATLINARSPSEITLMPNTAAGLNTAAASLPFRTGDNVLVLDGDYPANIYPWQQLALRGVLTKVVPTRDGGLDLNMLEARIDARTRAIALSTVMFATGFRNAIEAVGKICKERGIYFVVDAIQSLGAFPLDVQAANIDFLAAGSQKWLLSTPGSGFLYCREEIMDDLVPGAYVGASSVVDPMNFLDYNLTFPRNAARFDLGTPNIIGALALNASVKLILEVGQERIAKQINSLVATLIDDLSERGYALSASTAPEHRSGIITARIANPEAANQRLEAANIIATIRGAGVRFAPHFYNTIDEMLQVGEVLG